MKTMLLLRYYYSNIARMRDTDKKPFDDTKEEPVTSLPSEQPPTNKRRRVQTSIEHPSR